MNPWQDLPPVELDVLIRNDGCLERQRLRRVVGTLYCQFGQRQQQRELRS
jgi:hypothetical protein